MSVLLVFLGGALGAPLRFCLASWLDDPERPRFLGTLAVNASGSFLLGLFSALALSDHAYALLGVGLCGGFTTYSSFAVQTVRSGPRSGTAYAVATIVGGIALCALGFVLGS